MDLSWVHLIGVNILLSLFVAVLHNSIIFLIAWELTLVVGFQRCETLIVIRRFTILQDLTFVWIVTGTFQHLIRYSPRYQEETVTFDESIIHRFLNMHLLLRFSLIHIQCVLLNIFHIFCLVPSFERFLWDFSPIDILSLLHEIWISYLWLLGVLMDRHMD